MCGSLSLTGSRAWNFYPSARITLGLLHIEVALF